MSLVHLSHFDNFILSIQHVKDLNYSVPTKNHIFFLLFAHIRLLMGYLSYMNIF